MNGLVSYSDDEDEGLEPKSAQQLIHPDKNQINSLKQSSNPTSNLGIKKAASSSTPNSNPSTPIAANSQPRTSNSDSQSQLEQHPSPAFRFQRPVEGQGQEREPSSSTRLRALFFPPQKPKREAADHTLDQWDHEWDLGEEAVGEVDEALQLKLSNFHSLKSQGTHFNPTLSSSRAFRNPHIYSKLVNFVEIDERRSCYSEEFELRSSKRSKMNDDKKEENKDQVRASWNSMDPETLREGSKERLATLQRSQADERQKSQAGGKRSQIDFTSSSSSSASGSGSKKDKDRDRDGRKDHSHPRASGAGQSQSDAVKRALAARDSLGLKGSASGNRERERDRDRNRDGRDRDRR